MEDIDCDLDLDALPRAPTQAEWDAMTPAQREEVVGALPCYAVEGEFALPEGDGHSAPIRSTRDALGGWFDRKERSVYIGVDLMVYYPGRQRFAPDIFVVFDVDPSPRQKWVVSAEGRGLDWVLEVLYGGNRQKDLERNVRLYAELGIPEYFVYDAKAQRIHGFRLPDPNATSYVPILPQYGRYPSRVLGFDLCIEEDRLRFFSANAALLETPELLDRMEGAVAALERRLAQESAARSDAEQARAEEAAARAEAEQARAEEAAARAEAEQAQAEAERARAEAEQARTDAERRTAELEAELERLKRER